MQGRMQAQKPKRKPTKRETKREIERLRRKKWETQRKLAFYEGR